MKEEGKTEPRYNTLNPTFEKKFIIPFNQDLKQRVRFEVYDVDNDKELDCLAKQDFIGYIEAELSDIVHAGGEGFKRPLISFKPTRKKKGIIQIRVNESDIGQSKLSITLGVSDLQTRNMMKFRVYGSTYKKINARLYESEWVKNTNKGCMFKEFAINSNLLVEESVDLKFLFIESKKYRELDIGEVKISILGLHNKSKKGINIYRNKGVVGKMKIQNVERANKKTFLKYIYSEYCLKLMIAIDFSQPKKWTKNQQSVYYEEFEEAIMKLGTLMKYYDNDNRIPCIGFGGKLPPYYNVISHCFALNGNFFDPTIDGLENIVKTFRQKTKEIRQHVSSIFVDIINYGSY